MSLRALMYHDIEAAATRNRYSFSSADFAAHMAAVKAAADGAPSVERGPSGPSAGYAITFDDGHPGWLAAADALEALGWRAYFFVISGRIGAAGGLDKAAIRRLDGAGHVIGSHSVDHPYHLASRGRDFIVDQWARSKAALEDVVGHEVLSASVPGGSYDRGVGLAADAAGVRQLFTSEPVASSWEDGACRVFGRFTLYNGMGPDAAAALALGRLTATVPQYVSWNVKKAARTALRGPYHALRRALYPGTT